MLHQNDAAVGMAGVEGTAIVPDLDDDFNLLIGDTRSELIRIAVPHDVRDGQTTLERSSS
jgi:hypothetical protein